MSRQIKKQLQGFVASEELALIDVDEVGTKLLRELQKYSKDETLVDLDAPVAVAEAPVEEEDSIEAEALAELEYLCGNCFTHYSESELNKRNPELCNSCDEEAVQEVRP